MENWLWHYTIDSDAYWFPGIYISSDDGTTWKKLNTDGISWKNG